MSECIERIGDSVIVYDDALVDQADERMFAAPRREERAAGASELAGRGSTHFISVQGRDCVLRHYYRGGMVRHFSRDRFVWAGEARTRSFSEWRLLAALRDMELPVPRPVAGRYVRSGPFYRADLITERLQGVRSLAAALVDASRPVEAWKGIGAMLARFHRARVFHADLNAHNIQMGDSGDLYLLDFDRGRIMDAAGSWSNDNLQRLRRSLDKITRLDGAHFSAGDWDALLQGYRD
ncbi:MAG: 3-deoxy-D-manno-octulosonic acid kinase [Gammaproteobacteria bacterium]